MTKDLKSLLLRLYHGHGCLDGLNTELDELERNPITYNDGTDIDHLQQLLDYRNELRERWRTRLDIKKEMKRLTNEIIDILVTIDFPVDRKIPVTNDGLIHLFFWYNEDGEVHHELSV
jgi:hypothetical protein